MDTKISRVCYALLTVAVFSTIALGQIIIPPPRPPRPPRPEPSRPPALQVEIKEQNIRVTLRDGIANTDVEMVIHNPGDRIYEGVLLIPVPGDAAVHNLSMWMNGEEVQAELLDKDKARGIYEDIVRRMRDPALLEIAGDGLIRASIFPIEPKGDQKIRFQYAHETPADAGLYAYRYPLGARGEVGPKVGKMTVMVDIETTAPIKSVMSPTHDVDIATESPTSAKVGFEATDVELKGDFTLLVGVSEKDVGVQVVSYRDGKGDGYFMAVVGPGYTHDENAPHDEKAVVFVIDTSGSMRPQGKMDQVKRALADSLKRLNPADKFGIVDFSTTVRTFKAELSDAKPNNIDEALDYVDNLEARGLTAISDALGAALKMGDGVEVPFTVIFLTDGLPTSGLREPAQIVEMVQKAEVDNLRLFSFGVGYDVNTHMLDRLANENRGVPAYVAPNEDIEPKVNALTRRISYPALTDVSIRFRDIRTYDIFPQEMPDLFHGSHATLVGRYSGEGAKAIQISGKIRGENRVYHHEANFADSDTKADWLPRLWATRKIGYLLDQLRLHGESDELKEEVARLSREYGIITPYTSFLVLEDEDRRQRLGEAPSAPSRDMLRSELEGGRDEADRMKHQLMLDSTGEGAVQAAESLREMRSEIYRRGPSPATTATGDITRSIRQIGSKSYYLADGRWVVSAWDEEKPTVKVEYLSDEYFRLSREHPELARAFALGERVIAEHDGTYYEVIEGEE